MNIEKQIVSFFDIFNSNLTQDTLAKDWNEWKITQDYRAESRFGQYICNKYMVKGRSCREIFFEEDDSIAYWKISEAIGF